MNQGQALLRTHMGPRGEAHLRSPPVVGEGAQDFLPKIKCHLA